MNAADPWTVLGLPTTSTEAEIRARYVALVKKYPPDRKPEMFAQIRDAYRTIRNPRERARQEIFGPEPLGSLDELAEMLRRKERIPQGPEAWVQALKEIRQANGPDKT